MVLHPGLDSLGYGLIAACKRVWPLDICLADGDGDDALCLDVMCRQGIVIATVGVLSVSAL